MTAKIIERYAVHRQADSHMCVSPTKAALEYRYAWLHGIHLLAQELGVEVQALGETPNEWLERWRPRVRPGDRLVFE
jgi:hypothetical protein